MDLSTLAQQIVEKNEYLTLATTDESGKPWICILAYTFDKEYRFYYLSLPHSKHSKHIQNINSVSFSIFDSHQNFGSGVGLQVEGVAEVVQEKNREKVQKIYLDRPYPYGSTQHEFMQGVIPLLQNQTYLFYKLTPTHIWINDPQADIDRRVEVFLKRKS